MPQRIELTPQDEDRVAWERKACFVSRRKSIVWKPHGVPQHAKLSRHLWLDANHHTVLPSPNRANRYSTPETIFEDLADRWETETALESIVVKKAMHPTYQRIIGMGSPAVPLILRRLGREPRQWFWALTAITGEDPARGETTLAGASEAWLRWGRERGLVVD